MVSEIDAVKTVAGLMMAAARTAPKSMGIDSIAVKTVSGAEMQNIAKKMDAIGTTTGRTFFNANAEQVRASDMMVLIGVKGQLPIGGNCGGCGHATCTEFVKAVKNTPADAEYPGPNCVFKISDLGIAAGSAVKCAASHNIDNRVMYTAGVAARRLGMMEDSTVVYAIPLKASGKNIFFAPGLEH